MASGKKGKKTKGKTLALNDFLQETPGAIPIQPIRKSNVNWADEVDEHDLFETRKAVNVVLPTAPKASRDYEDKVPKDPPYCAYISNLPYDIDEEEIMDFFKDMRIASLRIPKDDRGGEIPRSKGYGYVEFEDRESLLDALILRDTNLKNRRIRIEVATNTDGDRRRGMGMMGRDREGGAFSSGDWRSGARSESSDERRSFRDDRGGGREGGGGAFTREGMREGGITGERGGRDSYRSNRDDRGPQDDGPGAWRTGDRPSFNRDRDRGGFSRDGDRDRDRGFTRDGDRGFSRDGDREERRGFGGRRFEDRERSEGFNRGGRDDRDRSEGFSRDGRDNRDNRDDRDGSDRERDQPRSRPKLMLAPRTKPIEPVAAEPATTAASIFGSAKPVDTTQREREIEEKLAKTQTTDRPTRDRDGSRDRRPISRERRRGGSRDRRPDSRHGSRAGSKERRYDSRDRRNGSRGRRSDSRDGRADSRDRRGDSDDDRRPSSRGSPERRSPGRSPDRRDEDRSPARRPPSRDDRDRSPDRRPEGVEGRFDSRDRRHSPVRDRRHSPNTAGRSPNREWRPPSRDDRPDSRDRSDGSRDKRHGGDIEGDRKNVERGRPPRKMDDNNPNKDSQHRKNDDKKSHSRNDNKSPDKADNRHKNEKHRRDEKRDMPKLTEPAPPNFAQNNKFAFLAPEDDDDNDTSN